MPENSLQKNISSTIYGFKIPKWGDILVLIKIITGKIFYINFIEQCIQQFLFNYCSD
jgi:hypothetical protein